LPADQPHRGFSVSVGTAAFPHRLFSLPTPIALNLAGVAFAGGLLALGMAIAATVGIWRTGRPGTARVVFGTLVSLGLLLWPLAYLPSYEALPNINDVTTDTATPPQFVELAKQRPRGANPIDYPGPDFAKKQVAAYPDIKPIEVDRSTDEVFELALDAVRRLKWDIVNQEVPDLESRRPGLIEVADRTLIVRVTTTSQSACPATVSTRGSMFARRRATARTTLDAMPSASASCSRTSSCGSNPWLAAHGKDADEAKPASKRNSNAVGVRGVVAGDEAALCQVLDVRAQRHHRSADHVLVEIAVNHRQQLARRVRALAHRLEDRLLAPATVQKIGLHRSSRLGDRAAVTRQQQGVLALEQNLERAQVIGHASFGRGNDRRVPRHHVIAGEDDAPVVEGKAQVVGRVAGRVERIEPPILALDLVAAL
jgi:hypothetical protein